MAIAEDPLRYIRRFVRVEDELEPEPPPIGNGDVPDPRFIVDEQDLLIDDEICR